MIFDSKISILTLSLTTLLGLSACHDSYSKTPKLALPNYVEELSGTHIERKQYVSDNPVVTVQNESTSVALAPSIIQIVTAKSDLEMDRANQWAFRLDAKLNLLDQQGKKHGTLQQFLNDPSRRTLPLLAIQNEATLNALVQIANQIDLSDISLRSNDEQLLRKIHVMLPSSRTVLDLSQAKKLGSKRKDLADILHRTNAAYSRIVILPSYMINKDNVSFLQQRLLTVWGESTGQDFAAAGRTLVSGLNGIITSNSYPYMDILSTMPKPTLLRKPLIIGHRGVPSLEDENTLESAKKAVALGADIVENDIYITKDKHLVIMHDPMVDRTTNGKGYIEQMTLAEVKQLSTHRGHKVPTLAEYFQTFRDNKDMVHFVEIKSGHPELITELKKEIEQYSIEDQVVAISFNTAQIKRMKYQLPGYTTGLLTGNVPKTNDVHKDVKSLMDVTQRHASTFNSSYGNITSALLEVAKHRGISFWPWTFRDEKVFKHYYLTGVNGLTTDYTQFASKYMVNIQTMDNTERHIQVGETLHFPIQLTQQDGQKVLAEANQLILLSSQQALYRDTGSIRYIGSGTAYVMPGYQYSIDATHHYTIFAAPIKVKVSDVPAEVSVQVAP
ncbi:glycerophosphodiester phosphodiesterase [Acinetobacter rudis]|uniref:Glycerophosphodiester phosphodiesterase family protein n=1 Tax=Acinetobacter rudis TaxID=632955 RepID=A0AAW8J7B6_9GAMM|nr:glycerophosphodiester phosphodiesterase family protein [Acinetobacter rudis]MDQ8935347.1 glycerophosphodiester phosphodiesterase family protein [Acinetobacter rudis]MDQ8952343.1 glycerophosphodiester phosphodiesterase family protein [Acinetobacter rudis]MDQ9017610.1 glycerophosphodiester phosphodiesterase family protein [Acinetobacter rudis]